MRKELQITYSILGTAAVTINVTKSKFIHLYFKNNFEKCKNIFCFANKYFGFAELLWLYDQKLFHFICITKSFFFVLFFWSKRFKLGEEMSLYLSEGFKEVIFWH